MLKRKFARLALALLMLVLCSVQPALAAEERELRVVAPWEIKGLEPSQSSNTFTRMNCLERLVASDYNGKPQGVLAESWTTSPDKLTWTFNLRQGVLFHDGSPLNSEIAAKCLNRSLKKKGILTRVPIAEIKAQGRDKVVIITKIPFSPLLAFLCHSSAAIMAPSSFDAEDKIIAVVGTGPFKVVSNEGGKLYRFERFEKYWGEKPNIAKASYHAVPKGQTRSFMIQAGQAELSFTLAPMDIAKLDSSKEVKAAVMTIARSRVLKVNCGSPFFSDVRVRKAISLALNREAIAKTILRNPEAAADQLLAPALGLWHDPNLPKLTCDPAQSGKLLDQAGWKMGPDNIRVKDGQKFEVDLVTYASRPMLPLIAAAIQEQLKQVGLKVELKVGESSVLVDRHKDGTLQMALFARNFGMTPDPIGTITDFGPGGSEWGAMGWESESMATLLKDYMSCFDPKEAIGIRSNIVGILQDQLPVIPISWYENVVGVSNKVKDVTIDRLESSYRLVPIRWAD